MVVRRVVTLSLLLCSAAFLSAQSDSSDLRRVAVFTELAENTSLSSADVALIQSSFLITLASEASTILVVNAGRSLTVLSERERSDVTIGLEADAWIAVVLSGGLEQLSFDVVAYDLVTRKEVYAATTNREVPTRYRDLDRRLWRATAAELDIAFDGIEFGVPVTFEAAPGTSISGVLPEPVVIGESGSSTVRLPNPSAYQIRATAFGLIPVQQEFTLEDDPLTVSLFQESSPRFQVDVYAHTLNFPGGSFAWMALPDLLMVRFGVTTYLAGLYLVESEDVPLSTVLSYPYSQLELMAAAYLNPADDLVRFYTGLSLMFRLIHSSDYLGLDPLAPLAAGVHGGIQAELLNWFIAYLEYTPTLYFSRDPQLLAGSYAGNYDAFYAVSLGSLFLDLFSFRAGVRIPL